MMVEIYVLSIYVTIHQEDEIKKLFKSHGWEYERADEVERNKGKFGITVLFCM